MVESSTKISVLFVCMGNICRSPTAEGVFRKFVSDHGAELDLEIDSAGTHAYHIGEPPDARAQEAARRRGVDLSYIRARKVTESDFERFDLVLAMDRDNYEMLRMRDRTATEGRVRLFLEFAPGAGVEEVPDPYYGGANGFERVLDLVEEASKGLLDHLKKNAR